MLYQLYNSMFYVLTTEARVKKLAPIKCIILSPPVATAAVWSKAYSLSVVALIVWQYRNFSLDCLMQLCLAVL